MKELILEPGARHEGKVRSYFNTAINERIERYNKGIPVTLVALNSNREHLVNHLTGIKHQTISKDMSNSSAL